MLATVGSTTTPCAVCRRWGGSLVCDPCLARHGDPAAPRCPRCASRLPPEMPQCPACRHDPPPQSRTVCAVDYAFPWDALLRRLKFGGQVELARPLGRMLAQAVDAAGGPAPDVATVVPLAARRLASRGYNQAWLIAQQACRGRRLPLRHDLLVRLVDTPGQATLDRAQRLANLRDAFGVSAAARGGVAGRRIAIVDDVVTTGATVAECARALHAAGAADVVVWAVARTPAGAASS